MIYTGYYAKLDEYKEKGLTPISISGEPPEWYEGLHWKYLAPNLSTFLNWKRDGNEFTYMNEYLPKLEKYRDRLIEDLKTVENPIFLCYEKEGFCHRHLLADYIEMNLGKRVDEI